MSLIETKEVRNSENLSERKQNALIYRFLGWKGTFWQFFRYCLVGGANTLIDLLVLNILLWRIPSNSVQMLVVYNSIAYASGALSSFFLNKYWTFKHSHRTTRREAIRFMITLFLEIIYSNGLVWVVGRALQPLIANVTLWGNATKLLAIAGSVIISFAFMRFWTFAGGSRHRGAVKKSLDSATSEAQLTSISGEGEHVQRQVEN